MLNKIKKNKLPLFLLALVVMLSVYYVSLENNPKVDTPVGNLEGNVVSRYQEFAEERISLLAERDTLVAELESKLVSATISMTDASKTVEEITKITSLTEKEVAFEELVIDMGYDDALVVLVEDNNLTISVLADDFNVTDYISLAKSAKEEFGTKTLVTVNLVKNNNL